MAIFLIVTAVVLFCGLFVGLLLSFQEIEEGRHKPASPRRVQQVPTFYGWSERDAVLAEQMMLRQIEHHLRREALIAEQFINDPSPETLRAGEHSRLGVH
jgi:hypothetical protein